MGACASLETLSLKETFITDACLADVNRLSELRSLNLWSDIKKTDRPHITGLHLDRLRDLTTCINGFDAAKNSRIRRFRCISTVVVRK